MVCKKCRFYIPYDVYSFIGLCKAKNRTKFFDSNPCEKFENRNINEDLKRLGRVYCLTCKTWVYLWDLNEHKGT